jgi:hypothetical protein
MRFPRKVFGNAGHQCKTAGLVKGEGFAVDASAIEADASHFKRSEYVCGHYQRTSQKSPVLGLLNTLSYEEMKPAALQNGGFLPRGSSFFA